MSRWTNLARTVRTAVGSVAATPAPARGSFGGFARSSGTATAGMGGLGGAGSAARAALVELACGVGAGGRRTVAQQAAASFARNGPGLRQAASAAAVGACRLLAAPASTGSTDGCLVEGEEEDDETTTTSQRSKKRRTQPPPALVSRSGGSIQGGAGARRGLAASAGGPGAPGGDGDGARWAEMTHLRPGSGDAHMVDISGKRPSAREAVARAVVRLTPRARACLDDASTAAKGDAAAVARVAAIQAAKRTVDLIPLAHPVSLTSVTADVLLSATSDDCAVVCTARCEGKTGVEMEAMTGAAVGALAIYDMLKGVDKGISVGDVRLLAKTGGKSGAWHHALGGVGEEEYARMRQDAGGRHPGTEWD